ARGLAVIRAFDADHAELTLSEVARRAELPRAAARRFLRTLAVLGYVRSDGKVFRLTPRVLELGFSYLSALSLPEIAQPHLERLSHELDESVSAAVLDGDDIVYVARVATRRIMSVDITIGTRFPAHLTSMGRVLTGHETAAAGWALTDQELEQGLRSVAAPVRDRHGRTIAAVNVSTSAARTTLDRMRAEFVPALLDTASAIERELALSDGSHR